MATSLNSKIPLWINIMQGLLIVIMLQQVYMFFFDHSAVADSGVFVDGSSANLNMLYEFASRTAVMALVSLVVMVSQDPKYFLVVLLMNLLREGQETVIDPLFPLVNAPLSPLADLLVHLVIVAVELWAFITVYRIIRRMEAPLASVEG